jgi:hypothetical protein
MRITKIVAGLFLLSVFSRAHAQASSLPPDQDLQRPEVFANCIRLFEEDEAPANVDPKETAQKLGDRQQKEVSHLALGTSSVAPAVSTAVSLTASDEDGRGVISFARSSQASTGTQSALSLKVSAPFSKSKGQATFATLNGLSGDIDVSGAYSSFTWHINPTSYGQAVCQECKARGLGLLECSLDGLTDALEAQKTMSQSDIDALRDDLENRLFGVSTTWSAEASAGRAERSFFATDATKQSENRVGYSGSLLGGLLFPRGSLYGKITGKRDYEENDPATLCSPIAGSVLQDCTSLPLGKAKVVDSLVSGLELRYFFPRFALAPSVQYDHKADVWGIEVPVFLVRNDKDAFTGGFKLGWRSDQDKVVAAVFVTKALRP